MQKSASNQLLYKVALGAGTRLVNFQASAATFSSADLLRPQIELPRKLGRALAFYLNEISMVRCDPCKKTRLKQNILPKYNISFHLLALQLSVRCLM